jgi:hypothetical protein
VIVLLAAVVVAMKKAVATPVAVEAAAVTTVPQPVLPSAPLPRSSARPSVPLQPSRMTISAKVRSQTAWKTMTFRFDASAMVHL